MNQYSVLLVGKQVVGTFVYLQQAISVHDTCPSSQKQVLQSSGKLSPEL